MGARRRDSRAIILCDEFAFQMTGLGRTLRLSGNRVVRRGREAVGFEPEARNFS